jgi:hypothetical protein
MIHFGKCKTISNGIYVDTGYYHAGNITKPSKDHLKDSPHYEFWFIDADYIDLLKNIINEKFNSDKIHFIVNITPGMVQLQFKFYDKADEAAFLLWSSNGTGIDI